MIYVGHGVSAAPDATVWVAIRPEKIHISTRDRPASGDNRRRRAWSRRSPISATCRSTWCAWPAGAWCASRSRTSSGDRQRSDHLGRAGLAHLGCVEPGGGAPSEARPVARQGQFAIRAGGADGVDPRARAAIAGRASGCAAGRDGSDRRHRGAVPLAAAVLPRCRSYRAEDLGLATSDRHAALRAARDLGRRTQVMQLKLNLAQLRVPLRGLALPQCLCRTRS